MRPWWALVVAVALLAGCTRPLAAGAEPDRPSIPPPDQEVKGHLLAFNGTLLVSALPTPLAPVWSPDQPMNCVVLNSIDDQQSYLGGAVVDLVWSSAVPELEVTLSDDYGLEWVGHGASPLHLVFLAGEDEGENNMLTPLTLKVQPPGGGVFEDTTAELGVAIGLLESLIAGLQGDQCNA